MTRRVVPAALLLFCAASIVGSRITLRNRRPAPLLPPVAMALPIRDARLLALSFDSVISDLLWIRFIQDVPNNPADEPTGRALSAQLRAVTSLDPTFRAPYVHGTVLLSVLGNQPCSALEILEDGIPRFPNDWRLSFQAGYECFSELGDTACAERHMTRAASIPGSPRWLPGLVARFLVANQRTAASIEYLENAIAHTPDSALKAQFEERLKQARLTGELEHLDRAVREYRTRHEGGLPGNLEALVADGILPSIPKQDPVGGQFFLSTDGRVRSSSGQGKLLPQRVEGGGRDILQRILPERIESRIAGVIGHPTWLHFESDRVATAAGILDFSLIGMNLALGQTEQDETRQTLQDFLARTIMAHDVALLKHSQLSMLRENPAHAPTIAEIGARAGVPDHDPFGSKYRIDPQGIAEQAADRHPMVNVHGRGAAACR